MLRMDDKRRKGMRIPFIDEKRGREDGNTCCRACFLFGFSSFGASEACASGPFRKTKISQEVKRRRYHKEMGRSSEERRISARVGICVFFVYLISWYIPSLLSFASPLVWCDRRLFCPDLRFPSVLFSFHVEISCFIQEISDWIEWLHWLRLSWIAFEESPVNSLSHSFIHSFSSFLVKKEKKKMKEWEGELGK